MVKINQIAPPISLKKGDTAPINLKNDVGKPIASCLKDFAYALLGIAEVSTQGAKKYARGSWQHLINGEERYQDAKMRHYLESRHEEYDPDFGLLHDIHEAWCTLAVLELKLRRIGIANMYDPTVQVIKSCDRVDCIRYSKKRVHNCTLTMGLTCHYETKNLAGL